MKNNIITLTDSYKFSHWKIYPQDLEVMYSYFESRPGARWDGTLFFGLQYYIKEFLAGVVVTKEKIQQAKELVEAHIGPGVFNEKGWLRLLEKYKGKLPVRIKAVPEGTVVPIDNVMMTIENTDPEFAWLTNYLETLLVQVWYANAVATNSYEQKKIITEYLEKTGDPGGVGFKLHDFGFRGATTVEAAGVGGAAHLVNFMGSDTVKGVELLRDYYSAGICGFSIPATEHSQMSLLGRKGEEKMMERLLTEFPTGLVACVSDTYDIYNACRNLWGNKLKDLVLKREGTLVVRPDSGKAEEILPELLKILGSALGQTKNAKGYWVLNDKVRVIQGDNVSIETLKVFLDAITDAGYSADDIAFGSGGGLLQKVNRDTQRNAFKCSWAKIDGKGVDVYKDPVTAKDYAKKSKPGRLALVPDGDTVKTIKVEGEQDHPEDLLVEVFRDGELTKEYTLDEIRKNSEIKVPATV